MPTNTTETEARLRRIEEALFEIGIEEFRPQQITTMTAHISQNMQAAIADPEHAQDHRFPGLVDTKIGNLNPAEWEKVPERAQAIACAFAGTNWKVSLITKQTDGTISEELLETYPVPLNSREHTPQSLTTLMALTIDQAVFAHPELVDISKIFAVAIALGFAQDNLITAMGLDARLTDKANAKKWIFTGFHPELPPEERPSLGAMTVDKLLTMKDYPSLRAYAYRNDTQGVAEHGQTFEEDTLPVGFVFGTGDNAAFGSINFELGKFLIAESPILAKMREMGFIETEAYWLEYMMGGDFIYYMLRAALALLQERGLIYDGEKAIQELMDTQAGAIISELAGGQAKSAEAMAMLEQASPIRETLNMISIKILKRAGSLMGIIMASVVKQTDYDGHSVKFLPIEGDVFWQGYGVKESAREALDLSMPGNQLKFKQASGMAGVGALALTYAFKDQDEA